MSGVRLLVGTRKGAFVLTSDAKRKDWKVDGPHFAGWEIYHMKGSPVDPDRIYASQTSGWFGQIIQRSDDGGKTWMTPGSSPEELQGEGGMQKGESNKFVYDGIPGTHQWYDGTQHPWEFKRVWHLEPALDDVDHVYAGVEDAALFESKDGGKSWSELSGLRQQDRKSTRLNSSHLVISYAVFCLKKKNKMHMQHEHLKIVIHTHNARGTYRCLNCVETATRA